MLKSARLEAAYEDGELSLSIYGPDGDQRHYTVTQDGPGVRIVPAVKGTKVLIDHASVCGAIFFWLKGDD